MRYLPKQIRQATANVLSQFVCPNFNYFQDSALSTHFPDEFFEVIAVSSLKHFGLIFYGNVELDTDANVKAI